MPNQVFRAGGFLYLAVPSPSFDEYGFGVQSLHHFGMVNPCKNPHRVGITSQQHAFMVLPCKLDTRLRLCIKSLQKRCLQ